MRTRITPSLVLSIIAVVLSLTGVGYAATQLPRDSVGSAQIKVGAVASAEVADGSLRPADFSDAAKDALGGKRGAKGAKGDKGETGAQGPAGPAGASSSGGGSGLTVTDANGVVAGTLLYVQHDDADAVTVVTPSRVVAQYNEAGYLRSFSQVVSLNADCSPPFYVRTSNAKNVNQAGLPYGGLPFAGATRSTPSVRSHDAPISPDSSVTVYFPDGGCDGRSADLFDSPASFTRLDPLAAGTVPARLESPYTFG